MKNRKVAFDAANKNPETGFYFYGDPKMLISVIRHLKRKLNKSMYKHCRGCDHLGFDRKCMMVCMKGYDGVCPRNEYDRRTASEKDERL